MGHIAERTVIFFTPCSTQRPYKSLASVYICAFAHLLVCNAFLPSSALFKQCRAPVAPLRKFTACSTQKAAWSKSNKRELTGGCRLHVHIPGSIQWLYLLIFHSSSFLGGQHLVALRSHPDAPTKCEKSWTTASSESTLESALHNLVWIPVFVFHNITFESQTKELGFDLFIWLHVKRLNSIVLF